MELKISVDIKNLEALIKRYPEASLRARRRYISEAVLLLQREIMLLTPEGAGPIHLRDTIFSAISFGEPVRGIDGTPAIYGESIEHGTKPHFPPVKPILFWVEKRLGLSGKEALSVACAIVRKIGKKGTYGTYMFKYGMERNRAKVIRMLKQIPADIIRAVSA